MPADFIPLITVSGSFMVLYLVLWLPCTRLLWPQGAWPGRVLGAILLGCSLQAISGVLWTRLVGGTPLGEVICYGVLWCVLTLISFLVKQPATSIGTRLQSQRVQNSTWWLLLILVAAFVLRSIHPLDVSYLGQSDAYTHLNYLHNIVNQGKLVNPSYPPGFHWILALPVFVFSMDPYWIARFGGAFFGTGLVLSIYLFLNRLFGRRAALLGSYCAACFPLMTLLMKTGVGVFANQFGLFLLPAIFLLYGEFVSSEHRLMTKAFFVLLLSALVATVPMMLLQVLLVIGAERLVALFTRIKRKRWLRETMILCLCVLPAAVLLLMQVGHLGPGQRKETVNILMQGGDKASGSSQVQKAGVKSVEKQKNSPVPNDLEKLPPYQPYIHLIKDYLSIKRLGFGTLPLDTVAIAIALLCTALLLYGLIAGKVGSLILGTWGTIAIIQSATGLMQFTAYQRSGWSLLIVVCCLSGVVSAGLYDAMGRRLWVKYLAIIIMVCCFGYSWLHPPVHPAFASRAEDDIVKISRFFGQNKEIRLQRCSTEKSLPCKLNQALVEAMPLSIVSRSFIGWGNQGQLVANVLPAGSAVTSETARSKSGEELFKPGKQYIVLVDQNRGASPQQGVTTFSLVAPGQVAATMQNFKRLRKGNKVLLNRLDLLDRKQWNVSRWQHSQALDLYYVKPKKASQD